MATGSLAKPGWPGGDHQDQHAPDQSRLLILAITRQRADGAAGRRFCYCLRTQAYRRESVRAALSTLSAAIREIRVP